MRFTLFACCGPALKGGIIDYLKTAGQPVPGPWPPHQEPRPRPEEDSLPARPASGTRRSRPADAVGYVPMG